MAGKPRKRLSKTSGKSEGKSGKKGIDKNTAVVLDSNEYILGISGDKKSCSELILLADKLNIYLPSIIEREVYRNLENQYRLGKEFYRLIQNAVNISIVYSDPPEDLVTVFETKGLAEEDSIIAAFCVWIGAEYLISENRHFLFEYEFEDFTVISAKEALTLIHV